MRYYSLPPNNINQSGSLASMIDIIFLLIIFFVVTASMDKEQLDMSVMPPEIATGLEIKTLPSDHLTINIHADGTVKIGYRVIPPDQIKSKLGPFLRELKTSNNTVLVVNGAENCRHKHIATVLEIAAQTGFEKASINAVIVPSIISEEHL